MPFSPACGRNGPVEIDRFGDAQSRSQGRVVFGTVDAAALSLAAKSWHLRRALVTARYAMKDYRDLLTGPARGIKNVIQLN